VGKMKKHWAVVLPLLMIGCTEANDQDGADGGVREPDPVPVVTPAPPKGTVSGQVLTTRMEPLSGASVAMTIGSATAEAPFTATTDGAGNFTFKNVPGGSQVLVTVSKDGFATLRASATVPSAAGNVPLDNANANLGAITLAETKSTVRFTLVTPSGQPAANAQAYLEALPAGTLAFNGGAATAVSSVVVAARADGQGVVSFTNVPAPAELARIGELGAEAGGYRLWVDPVDLNGDGMFEAGGYTRKFEASTLMVYGSSQLIKLPLPRNDAGSVDPQNPSAPMGFQVVATNVPSLNYVKLADNDPAKAQTELLKRPVRNMVRASTPLFIGFSQPVAKDSLLAILTDEFAQKKLELTVTPNATGDAYTLTPAPGDLKEGQEYNLLLRATSMYDGSVKTWKGFFISGEAQSPKPLQVTSVTYQDSTNSGTLGSLDPGECVTLHLSQSVLTNTTAKKLLRAYLTPGGVSTGTSVTPAAPPSADVCVGENAATLKFPINSTDFNDVTSRFVFAYSGGTSVAVGSTSKIQLRFEGFQTEELQAYYETPWGAPIASTTVIEAPITRP
jgi:hypothetical protein